MTGYIITYTVPGKQGVYVYTDNTIKDPIAKGTAARIFNSYYDAESQVKKFLQNYNYTIHALNSQLS